MRRLSVTLFALVILFVPLVGGVGAGSATSATGRSGYWVLDSDGEVYAFGDAKDHGDQTAVLRANPSFHGSPVRRHEAVDLEPSPSGEGYWILSNAGMVDAYGDIRGRVFIDHPPALRFDEEATSLSATPSGQGLWVFTSQGRVITYGDARHIGDMAGTRLNGAVLDAVPTRSGNGYWMVGSDGGIFAFGDAPFHGSMGDQRLNAPVQSLVPDGDGDGYWLVASDGGIFAFDAPFRGSMGGTRLNRPVTGMVRFGNGYLMVGSDGGIFTFSDRPFVGSLGNRPPDGPIISIAALEAPPASASTDRDSVPEPGGRAAPEPTTTTGAAPEASTTTTRPSGTDPPTGAATHEDDCRHGTDKTVRVWIYDSEASAATWGVDNPCAGDWVVIDFPGGDGTRPSGRVLSVAPATSFRAPLSGWTTDRPATEAVDVTREPYTECYPNYELWSVGPGTHGQLELGAVCPTTDDEGDLHYDGPLCFGEVPDYVGSDRDDRWGNVDEDVNGDGHVTIYGGGGNDRWTSGGIDSGTFIDTRFCGGPGDDEAIGWLEAIDGGDGTDHFSPTACGTSWREPTVVDVEFVAPYSECPEGTP